ncbi:MAG: DUF3053 domain-containing protein [Alphaproteobacteria bacterium]|nr:DUF3053 domain-containing protein [Alphaproteobacteria bacterium]
MLFLAGCGSKEPEQRKAFIAFMEYAVAHWTTDSMQTLDHQQKEKFGPYADHYQIIVDFNAAMSEGNKALSEPNKVQQKLTNLKQLQDNWQQIAPLRSQMTRVADSLAGDLRKAEDLRAGLKQPDDVKSVYDKLFAKLVTTPAKAIRTVMPSLQETFQVTEEKGQFLSENRGAVKISPLGMSVDVPDPALASKWKEILKREEAAGRHLLNAIAEVAAQ